MKKVLIIAALLVLLFGGLALASPNSDSNIEEPGSEFRVKPTDVLCLDGARKHVIDFFKWFEANGFTVAPPQQGPQGVPVFGVFHKDFGFVMLMPNMKNWCVLTDVPE